MKPEIRNGKFVAWFKPRLVVSYGNQCACLIPKWYGVAYQDLSTASIVMWWIPLNLIARFFFKARLYLKHGALWPPRRKILAEEVEELRAKVKELELVNEGLRLKIKLALARICQESDGN